MKLVPCLLVSFCLLIYSAGYSQETRTVNSKILDEKLQPVANAHIVLKNHLAGTISDKAGFFKLILAKEHLNDTLIISHISFVDLALPLPGISIDTGLQVFTLKRKNYLLDEVGIEHLKPVAIYGKAMEQLDENYHKQPAVLEVYYFNSEMRHWAKTGKTEWRNGESTILMLDRSWAKQQNIRPDDNEKIRLIQNQFNTSPGKPEKKWWKNNILQTLMGHNVYKHKQFHCIPNDESKKKKLVFSETNLGPDSLYILEFVTIGKPLTRYFIKKRDYKIMRIEEYRTPETTSKCNDTMVLFKRHSYLLAYDTTIINFQEIDNEIYLKDIHSSSYGMFRDIETDTLISANHYIYKMVVTEINPSESQLPSQGKETKISKSFYLNDKNGTEFNQTEKYKHLEPKIMLPDSLRDFMERVRGGL